MRAVSLLVFAVIMVTSRAAPSARLDSKGELILGDEPLVDTASTMGEKPDVSGVTKGTVVEDKGVLIDLNKKTLADDDNSSSSSSSSSSSWSSSRSPSLDMKDSTIAKEIKSSVSNMDEMSTPSKPVDSGATKADEAEIKEVPTVPRITIQAVDVKEPSANIHQDTEHSTKNTAALIMSKLKDLEEAVAESVTNLPAKPDSHDSTHKYTDIIKQFVAELLTIPQVLLNAISNAVSRVTGSKVNPATVVAVYGPHPH